MVNEPEPVQPVLPVSVQVPEIELPLSVPASVSVFPDGDVDWIVIPKVPLVFPLKSPVTPNDPVSVAPLAKHGELVVKLKLVTLRVPSPLAFNDVPNWNIVLLLLPTSVALQVPLTLFAFELLEPHPIRVMPNNSSTAIPNCFIKIPPV